MFKMVSLAVIWKLSFKPVSEVNAESESWTSLPHSFMKEALLTSQVSKVEVAISRGMSARNGWHNRAMHL